MNPVWHFLNGVPYIGPLSIQNTTITLTGPVLAADGAGAAPSIAFASDPDTGLAKTALNRLGIASGGGYLAEFGNGALTFISTTALGWNSSATDPTVAADVSLSRGAADVLTTPDRFVSTGPVAGIGYATGAGGAVTQLTSKSTGVTLNTVTGEITMNGAALAADTTVSFTLTNTAIAVGDMVFVTHVSAGTQAAYNCTAVAAAGSATVNVRNVTPGSLSEAIVLKFVVFKAVTA